MRRITMTMADWVHKLDGFLTLNDRNVLEHAGKISHQIAKQLAEQEYDKFQQQRVANETEQADEALEKLTKTVEQIPTKKNKK